MSFFCQCQKIIFYLHWSINYLKAVAPAGPVVKLPSSKLLIVCPWKAPCHGFSKLLSVKIIAINKDVWSWSSGANCKIRQQANNQFHLNQASCLQMKCWELWVVLLLSLWYPATDHCTWEPEETSNEPADRRSGQHD